LARRGESPTVDANGSTEDVEGKPVLDGVEAAFAGLDDGF